MYEVAALAPSFARVEGDVPRNTLYVLIVSPAGPGVQFSPICVLETAVATRLVGAEGNASVVADAVFDSGEISPPESTSSTA